MNQNLKKKCAAEVVDTESVDCIALTPVYNDWDSFAVLVAEIDQVASELGLNVKIIAVDDNSTQSTSEDKQIFHSNNVQSIEILRLAYNVGHQRAIAIGLAYITDNLKSRHVVVMDSDGEDRPKDIVTLLSQSLKNPGKLIVARRNRREESLLFKLLYRIHKVLLLMLSGYSIKFGNFSLIPFELLKRITVIPEIWNCYSASLVKYRVPLSEVLIDRGTRYTGKSKMSLTNLVLHSFSIISVFMEDVCMRMLRIFAVLEVIAVAGLFTVLGIKLLTEAAIPGWTSNMMLLLSIVLFLMLIIMLFFVFLLLQHRKLSATIPSMQYALHIIKVENWCNVLRG